MEKQRTISKPNSIISNSGNSRMTYGAEGGANSTRSSMDMIEGTTQHFPVNGGNTLKNDASIQRQRWDAFFEPQYSFGAFVHGDQEEKKDGHKYQHRKNIDQLVDDGNVLLKSPTPVSRASFTTENSTAAMTPTLPNLLDDRNSGGKDPAWGPTDEKTLIERLELLKKMRAQPTAVINDKEKAKEDQDDQGENRKVGLDEKIKQEASQTTARWKRQISEKAKQYCKEAKKSNDSGSTISSLDPDEKVTAEEDEENAAEEQPVRCRRSFIWFMLGFLFPPVWLFGAFYISSQANRQTSASRRIDHVWRKRSRIAFGIFTISLMIIMVIIFVLKPGSVGWRLSKGGPSTNGGN
jgi:hypothetical protein